MTYNWTKFEKQVFINADVQTVFNAWAVPNEIVKWFIAEVDYMTVGDQFRPKWV